MIGNLASDFIVTLWGKYLYSSLTRWFFKGRIHHLCGFIESDFGEYIFDMPQIFLIDIFWEKMMHAFIFYGGIALNTAISADITFQFFMVHILKYDLENAREIVVLIFLICNNFWNFLIRIS